MKEVHTSQPPFQVYGPHISGLYVRHSVLKTSVTPIVHHFLKVNDVAYKLQPGGPGYETVYGTTGVLAYLLSLTPANNLQASWDAIALHEQTLVEPLIRYLTEPKQWARGVRVVGDATVNLTRVPTISFVVVGDRAINSKDIIEVFDKKGGVSLRTQVRNTVQSDLNCRSVSDMATFTLIHSSPI